MDMDSTADFSYLQDHELLQKASAIRANLIAGSYSCTTEVTWARRDLEALTAELIARGLSR